MKKQIDLQNSLFQKISLIKQHINGQLNMPNKLNSSFNLERLQIIENNLNNMRKDILQFSQNQDLQTTYNTCLQQLQQLKQQLKQQQIAAQTTTQVPKQAVSVSKPTNTAPQNITSSQNVTATQTTNSIKKSKVAATTTKSTQSNIPTQRKIYKTVTLNYPTGSKLTINQLSPLTPCSKPLIQKNDYLIANSEAYPSFITYEIIREAKQRNGEIFTFTDIVYGYIDIDKLQLMTSTPNPSPDLCRYCESVNEQLISHSHILECIKDLNINIGQLSLGILGAYTPTPLHNPEFSNAIYIHTLTKHGLTLTINRDFYTELVDIIPFTKIEHKSNSDSSVDSSMYAYLISSYIKDNDTNIVRASMRPHPTKIIYGQLDFDLLRSLKTSSATPSIQSENAKKYALQVIKNLQSANNLDYIGHSISTDNGTKLDLLPTFKQHFNYKNKAIYKNIDIPI